LRQQQRNEADRALLTAVARAVGTAAFLCDELIDHARLDPGLAAALGRLRSAPKRLGKRLARLAALEQCGVWLARVKETRDGWMWQVHFRSPDNRMGPD
jgi:hypothetical protein